MKLDRYNRITDISQSDRNVIVGAIAAGFTGFLAVLVCIAGYITHIIVTLKTAAYVLLLVGVLAPPVGIIHGIGCWFHVWSQ